MKARPPKPTGMKQLVFRDEIVCEEGDKIFIDDLNNPREAYVLRAATGKREPIEFYVDRGYE